MFDLIVPVYNSMHHVRTCLRSINKYSTLPYQLYVVDDCSNAYTATQLEQELQAFDSSKISLIKNEENLGYLKSCNSAIAQGQNPYVILINSDTAVMPGYLERIKENFEKNEKVAIVNPVSTWANWTRIPFPNGLDIFQLAEKVRELSCGELKDINSASGFFFACRRAVYDEIGLFDEIYGPGYYEETDFCMRALEAGYRVTVDDSLYIFHYGWGSFNEGGRNENMQKNKDIFLERWGQKYLEIERQWKADNPLKTLEAELEKLKVQSQQESYNVTQDLILDLQQAALTPGLDLDQLRMQQHSNATSRSDDDSTNVIYILPKIALYGGVISVLQIVNQLVLNGINANVATYSEPDPELLRKFPMYFRPHCFANEIDMINNFPDCDLIIATHWKTAYPALALQKLTGTALAYFVQDYEPDFHAKTHPEFAKQAALTYELIPNQIVKSEWLRTKLSEHSGIVHKIPLGLNLDIFNDYEQPRELQILSHARPSSPYRNFKTLQEVYARLYKERPEISLAVYGNGYTDNDFDCPIINYGRLDEAKKVANALNESTLLLDASTFQGFGRPGLEAMACGTAAVLTRVGGITEYAKHDHNCVLIDPTKTNDIVSSVLELIDDQSKRERLVENGRHTATRYSYIDEGERTREYILALLKNERALLAHA